MSNQYLKLRRSAVPGRVPTTESIDFGEIALNTYDGLAFMKKSGSNGEQVVTIGSTTGAFTGSFTGSFIGDGSQLINIPTQSIDTGSLVTTSSFNSFTSSYNTGSFTGSFIGDGSQLIGITSASIIYVTSSNLALSEIQVEDYSSDVAVTFVGGRLKFIFGTPVPPTISSFTLSGFNIDRFNQQGDDYTTPASWVNNAYTFLTASIYSGSTLLATTSISNTTTLNYNAATTGSQQYRFEFTSSNPSNNALYYLTATATGTVSKSNPTNPSISSTPTVQLGGSSNQIEEGGTGSIAFSTTPGSANNWTYLSTTTTPITSPASVTATGNIIISVTGNYESPTGANIPQLTYNASTSTTYTRIRSVRYGASTATSFTLSDLQDLALWDTTLGGTIGTIAKGTVNPNNYQFTVNTTAQYIYIVIDSAYTLTGIINVNASNANDLPGAFGGGPIATVGNYKIYRSNGLSTTSILYKLTT